MILSIPFVRFARPKRPTDNMSLREADGFTDLIPNITTSVEENTAARETSGVSEGCSIQVNADDRRRRKSKVPNGTSELF